MNAAVDVDVDGVVDVVIVLEIEAKGELEVELVNDTKGLGLENGFEETGCVVKGEVV